LNSGVICGGQYPLPGGPLLCCTAVKKSYRILLGLPYASEFGNTEACNCRKNSWYLALCSFVNSFDKKIYILLYSVMLLFCEIYCLYLNSDAIGTPRGLGVPKPAGFSASDKCQLPIRCSIYS